MKKLYKLLIICLLTIAGGSNALKAQSYNSDNSETANRAETPTYISKIAVAYGANASTPKDILKNNGFTIIDKDLNAGCGSHTHYIYMGYKTTTNPADAITGIYIREGNDHPNSATFDGVTAYLLGGSTEDNPGENKPVDLNIDAGGATLHVYVSRNTNLAAITDIKFSNTNSMSGYVTQNIDLNKGASGEYIYLHYKQYSAQVYANFHYINESCQSVSKKFYGTLLHHLDDAEITPSIPTLLTYDDRSLAFMCWKDNTEAMMDYEYISKININLESSGMTFYGLYYFSPQTPLNLRFDANGGTGAPEDQKTDIFGLRYLNAGNGTPVYELSTFQIPNNICTKVGTCKFLGWSTDPNANSAEYQPGQSIDIALNTTLYAIYDSAHEYENGYCSICGAYEPAELVNGYYQIKTADNLFWFAEYINHIDRTASAKLMNDIDLEGRPWTPIGFTGEENNNFRGHFDGNGKTITGLNVEVTRSGGGFFGEVRLGTVEDFTIYGEVKLNGNHSYVGGVIGSAPGANSNQPEHNGATIRNITSYVNVTLGEGSHGSNHVAGFIGYANHETLIESCTWYGTLDLDAYRAQDGVGGLVGKANDNSEITIRNCAAYGTIKTSYQSGSYNSHNSIYIGGIVSNSVASAQTTLENCIWAGTLINNTNLGDNAHISAIGTLNGIKSVSNCYALNNMPYITTNDEHNTGITEVTAGQLASGEIAYKLQGTQATQIWGQNIDNEETANAKPILGGAKVYEHTFDGTTLYSNSQTLTAGGKCGDNLYWTVSNNTLTIFGTGAMYDYSSDNNKAPWRSLNLAPKSLVLEEGITHIGNSAFHGCSSFNGSLTIPNSVITIGVSAFDNCGFTGDLTIPNNVTSIGKTAFWACKGFTGSLTIPNSVTTIGDYAFQFCDGFTKVYSFAETAPTLGTSVFSGISSDATLYYLTSSEQSYKEKGWFKFFSKRIGFNGKCGDNLFWKVNDNTLTIFGAGAMWDYDNIDNKAPWRSLDPAPTSLVLEEGITHIGNYAFYGCDGFTEVHSSAVIAPTLGTEAFANINKNAILCHPVSSEPSYKEKGWFEYFLQHVGADGKCGDNLYWKVSNDVLTIFGTGAMYDYSSDNNKAPWRSLNLAPKSLVLEEGITHIGNSAFHGCSSINGSLTIPNSVITIGVSAFDNCPGFTGSLTIPNNVTSIGKTAFWACKGFTGSLTIPNSVTTIGDYAFQHCDGFTGSLTIPNSVTTIGSYAFSGCSGFTGSLTIPNSVTSIGESAFENCSGFNGSLTIPNSVTSIGYSAFYYCSGFKGDLTIPNSVTTIESYAFSGCSGFSGNLTIPNSVTTIRGYAFWGCSGFSGNLTIPNSVTTIGNYAFYNCSGFKGSLTIPNSVTSIGKKAFSDCSGFTGSLTIPNSVTTIENSAFDNCSGFTGSLTIPNSVTTIGNSAFHGCSSFTGSLTIPNSVTTIGVSAFDNCPGFTGSLTIPNSVTSIGNFAFRNCIRFTEVYSLAETAPTLGTDAFANINVNATLYYLASSEQSYNDKGWFNYFSKRIGLFDGKCGDNLYWVVNDNVLTISGTGAMYDYDNIDNKAPWCSLNPAPTSLVLEEGITHIGNDAFYQCSGFTGSLTIPNSVTSIGNFAFYGCKGFTGSLTIGNSVTTIGNSAFNTCYGFTGSLTIPNSVTSIGNDAFDNCNKFTEIFFYRDTNPTIGTSIFSYINTDAKVYAPVIWSSFAGITSEKLVKMATFVGQQTTDASTGSATINGWVGLAEGQTWPDEDDHVAINASLVLGSQQDYKTTRQQGRDVTPVASEILKVKSFGLCGNENTTNGNITIEDGGQLYCEVARGEVTVKKEIVGYAETTRQQDNKTTSESVWYTIASPLKDTIQIIPNSSFLTPNSDLYRYDEPSHTWQNAKPGPNSTNFQTLDPGRGYLYANAENTTLEFTGDINTEAVTYNLTAESDVLNGFHLIGNPFTHDISFAHLNATEGASLVNGYYVLNGEGAWGATLGSNEDDVIKVGQAALVKATAEGTLAISRQQSAVSRQQSRNSSQLTAHSSLQLTVANAKYSDRAFVVFDKGVGLDKMNHENEDIPMLYIPMDDADYAIAMMDINVNEIPVNFETNVMGEYTISLRQENCEFEELYLLDKETNTTVNILEQDYTFIATSSDNPERFVLIKDNRQQTTDNGQFVYQSGEELILSIEGSVQIVDMLGRIVYSNDVVSDNNRIDVSDFKDAAYVIRVVNEEGVKVQKVVIY